MVSFSWPNNANAIANAIADALAPFGATDLTGPATPSRIRKAIGS